MSKQRMHELALNGMLVVLSLLLLVLTLLTWLDDLRLDNLPPDSYLGKLYMDLNYGSGSFALRADEIPATYPVAIAVAEDGTMLGVEYQETGILGLYQTVEPQIISSITSTQDFIPTTEQDFAQALQQDGVFLQYDANIPYRLLASWMGVNISEDMAVTSLWFTRAGEVWVRDGKNDLFMATCMPFSTLWEISLEELTLSSCTFADTEAFSVRADVLVFADAPTQYPQVVEQPLHLLESPVNSTVQSVLQGFSYEVYRSYFDTITQTKVFVENNSTLRLSDGGVVRFRASSVEGALEAYGENEITDDLSTITAYARRLLEGILRSLDTDATLRLTHASIDPNTGNTRLVFGYAVAGIPIPTEHITVAQMEFHDHKLIAADLDLRSLQMDDTVTVLPMAQTLPLAQAEQGIYLAYLPTEEGFSPARCATIS